LSRAQGTRLAAELTNVEDQLRAAERALDSVNIAAGSVREQLTKAAGQVGTEVPAEKNFFFFSR
jgi:hypothetical protein